MITKYKLFEKNSNLQIGDYVVCYRDTTDMVNPHENDELQYFLINNIGQIINQYVNAENVYTVGYNRITENVSDYFGFYPDSNYPYQSSIFLKEILFFSSKKEDCKVFISSNKYNL